MEARQLHKAYVLLSSCRAPSDDTVHTWSFGGPEDVVTPVWCGARVGHLQEVTGNVQPWSSNQPQTWQIRFCDLGKMPKWLLAHQSLVSTWPAKSAEPFLNPPAFFLLNLNHNSHRQNKRQADLLHSFPFFKEKELNWVIKTFEEEYLKQYPQTQVHLL